MIYFIRNELTRNVKIGTSKDPEITLRLLQEGTDCPMTLVAAIAGTEALEAQFHTKWHEYRLYDEGTAGQEWFAIDVSTNSRGGVDIVGRKKQRPPKRGKKEKRSNQLCLRLSDRQMELLQHYVQIRHFDSEVEALRFMIDGLADWLSRQSAKPDIAGSPARSAHTSKPRTDAPRTDVAKSSQDLDEADDSPETTVGDFAGRPSIGLPKSSWNDGNDE
ncbi:MAG: GIY-YIG nuclease family protein [Nitrospira sp.]